MASPSEPWIGHEFPTRKVSWLKRDVLLYNVSIGCKADEPHYVYEGHPNFTPFPTLPLGLGTLSIPSPLILRCSPC